MIRVARRVVDSGVAQRVRVATDDVRIARVVERAGIEAWLSEQRYRTGSDRVADAVADLDGETILNVQGDEPLVDRQILEQALIALEGNAIGTVAVPLRDRAQMADRDTVKVQVGGDSRAMAFSREPLPGCTLVHLGIYSFARESLERFAGLPTSPGERAERLEQLRALEQGMRIGVRVVDRPVASVNRPEDVLRVEAMTRCSVWRP